MKLSAVDLKMHLSTNWLHTLYTAYRFNYTYVLTRKKPFITHPPESLGCFHPRGFPMKTQWRPNWMFKHHFWSSPWQPVSSSVAAKFGISSIRDITAAPSANHRLLRQPTSLFHLWTNCHTQSHYTPYFRATACKQKQPWVPLSPNPTAWPAH